MFDLSKIMKDAWMLYRRNFTGYGRPSGKEGCSRAWKQALRNAWIWAKQRAAEALKTAEQKAADRLRELKSSLMSIDARPWGMRSYRVADDRAAIQAEIDKLERAFA